MRSEAVPTAWAAVPTVTPVCTSSRTLQWSNSHCPEAPYKPVSNTAATVSSGDAPVALAEGMARALETERWARASLRRGGRPAAAPGER